MSVHKTSLRKTALEKRLAIEASQHVAWSHDCAERLLGFIEFIAPTPMTIAGYVATRGEVDIMAALAALATHHKLALPLVTKDSKVLSFKHYTLSTPLAAGAFGIATPPADNAEVVPDIILTPLLAFDKAGHRLGYGGGYYDATLSSFGHNPIMAIGIAFSLQEVDVIPSASFDMRMQTIITEKEIISIS